MRLASLVLVGVLACGAAASAAPKGTPTDGFTASVSRVGWPELRYSYRAGCPVGPAQLRTVRVSYWGFDGRVREGRLVVNRRVTGDIVKVFRRLFAERFPLRRMVPVSVFRGSDEESMEGDNTSAFNCRRVPGSTSWSMHAYGLAIDVNPVENPYVRGRRVLPPTGRRYLDRTRYRPGMAVATGVLVRAFDSVGWKWGGRWKSAKDYQHFSTNGR